MTAPNQHSTPGELARWIVQSQGLTEEHSWKRLARGYLDLEEQLQTAERQRDLAQREAEMYKADRDEYDALLGRKMAERDGLLEQLEAANVALRKVMEVSAPGLRPYGIARDALNPSSQPRVMADSYPPDEDVARAGELAKERGWADVQFPASRLPKVAASGTGASESFDDYDYRMAGVPDE